MSNDDLINADTAGKFIERLHAGAGAAHAGMNRPCVLHLVSMAPDDHGMTVECFNIGDVDRMLEAGLDHARSGRNVYVEARTVRPGRPSERGRGKLESTIGCFAFVIDRDADTGKSGRALNGSASAVVETSPGNTQEWLFLSRALDAGDAKPLGEIIRKGAAADHATGTVTQPYRIPGFPNYPDAKKRARGRIVVATKLIAVTDRLWDPAEIEAEFSTGKTQAEKPQPAGKAAGALKQEAPHRSTPLRKVIAKAKIAAKVNAKTDRSAAFQSAVNAAARAGMTADQIEADMRAHPDGPQQKYLEDGDRLRPEIDRSLSKIEKPKEAGPAPGASIDGAAVLERVFEFNGRFIVYPDRHAQVAHTLWIAHTHLMDAWETTPRLAFLSPEPSSGKTRGLEITELLVPRPVAAMNVSAAFLIRTVSAEEGLPTILFDEADATFGPKAKDSNEEVRALINAGYRRGATVGRCVVYGTTVVPELLPAFAPVALAGLGNLPDTILTRSIIIGMRRRAPNEAVEPYRRRQCAPEGEALRNRLAAWAAVVAGRITVPDMPVEIVDRNADCWEPLIATADAAGGHWPDTVRVTAVKLVMVSREEREGSEGILLLGDMRTVLGNDDAKFTSAILDALCKLDESPWNDINNKGKALTDRELAVRLRAYSIKPKLVRIGANVARGYRREDFAEAWRRYLAPLPTP
jgi:hypothetical protein